MRARTTWILGALLVSAVATGSGCEDVSSGTPATPPPTQRLSISFDPLVGTKLLAVGIQTPYEDAAGNTYGVSRLQFLVSEFTLHRGAEAPVRIDEVHLVDVRDLATLRFTPRTSVPDGTYSGVSFVLGVGAAQGTADAVPDPPGPSFAWPEALGGGYHTLKLEGAYLDARRAPTAFAIHLGPTGRAGDPIAIDLPGAAFTLTPSSDVEVRVVVDVDRWLRSPNAYDLAAHGDIEGDPEAQRALRENARGAFRLASVGAPAPPPRLLPAGMTEPMPVPADNPTTRYGAALGRRLFYDPRLDGVSSRSCGLCHVQATSFTSDRRPGIRPHINLAFSDVFLWKGDVEGGLEDIMLFEVEEFFRADVRRFQGDPSYEAMFARAFGDAAITTTRMAYALAQFERTLVSGDSKYDRYIRGDASLSPAEEHGMWLFLNYAECATCHPPPLFTDNRLHNNGTSTAPDPGREEVTGDPADRGRFKTPTLRNVALTAPYMHDDSFPTLDAVVHLYSWGPLYSPTVDHALPFNMRLTPNEEADLVEFLKALTDESYTRDPALSRP